VLFHVQHLLGIGHLKRAEILAQAMAQEGLDVTVAYGGVPVAEVPFRAVKVAPLPPATIANEDFSTLLDESGKPIGEAWRGARRDALLALKRETDPDVVLIELFPFGRRQFAFELIPLLDEIHAERNRARVVTSVRDVLVASSKPGRDAERVEIVRRYFDAVLVHGDPALIPFGATFRAAEEIADLIHHTGYVVAQRVESASDAGLDEVIVSAGGGAVGGPLLRAAVSARALTPLAGKVWRLLTGPNLPEPEFQALTASTDDRTVVERFRPDFPELLRNAALSISQAGYNTTMDILATGARAVVIPYETRGETEQRLRAEILAAKGVVTLLRAAELSPERLAASIKDALAKPPIRADVDLSGAAETASFVRDLASRRSRRQE
jgi:predicted glycosyltransferase